jgi:enterochelin esterase-like enzyme
MHAVAVAAAAAALVAPELPSSFAPIRRGLDGGTIWDGRIPNRQVPDRRTSAIYLPPGFSDAQRYPVAYLLHGMRGSPSSFYGSLDVANVIDRLIAAHRVPPFIVVMPVAGPVRNPDSGEWAGVWEDYLVRDVVPWVDSHLPTIPTEHARALAGLCAGGFGALDIALRHPGLFGTLEAWDGYFRPFRDGPFVGASAADVAAHTPTLLAAREAAELRREGVRVFLSTGGNHGIVRASWTFAFSRELTRLGVRHTLWVLPHADRAHFWRSQLPAALTFLGEGFR